MMTNLLRSAALCLNASWRNAENTNMLPTPRSSNYLQEKRVTSKRCWVLLGSWLPCKSLRNIVWTSISMRTKKAPRYLITKRILLISSHSFARHYQWWRFRSVNLRRWWRSEMNKMLHIIKSWLLFSSTKKTTSSSTVTVSPISASWLTLTSTLTSKRRWKQLSKACATLTRRLIYWSRENFSILREWVTL